MTESVYVQIRSETPSDEATAAVHIALAAIQSALASDQPKPKVYKQTWHKGGECFAGLAMSFTVKT